MQMLTAYFNVCIQICHKYTVHDFHLLSIPVHERHTGHIIFNTFAKAVDDIYLDWREKIIWGSLDEKTKMKGQQ